MMLLRAGLRHHLRAPWQPVLAVLGIALGVATVVAVQLANSSAQQAFEHSVETLSGEATHRITAGSPGLDERVYADLPEPHPAAAAPVVEGFGVDAKGRTLRVLGVDPWSEWGIRDAVGQAAGTVGFRDWLQTPGAAVLFRPSAERLEVEAGGSVSVEVPAGERELRVLEVVDGPGRVEAGMRDTAVVDISTAQAWFEQRGFLTRIDVRLPDDAAAASLRHHLAETAPEARLDRVEAGMQALNEMTAAFRLNLTAFSLLALLVGTLLIYNAVAFSVVQRRAVFGRFRTLGVGRRRILAAVLLEGSVLGVLGVAVGLPLGWWFADFLLDQVTRTISDLYFVLTVQSVTLDPWRILGTVGLGLGVSAAASLAPAMEASRSSPREALQRATLEARALRWTVPLGLGGLVLAGIGAGTLYAPAAGPADGLAAAFIGLFLIIGGLGLAVPAAVRFGVAAMGPVLGRVFGVAGRMAGRSVVTGLSRSAVAAIALVIAVTAVIGVSVMIESFRHSLEVWLDSTLAADVYVSAPSIPGDRPRSVSAAWPERFAEWSSVDAVDTVRYFRVSAAEPEADGLPREIRIRIHDLDGPAGSRFQFLEGGPEGLEEFDGGRAAWITEPFAERTDLAPGDSMAVRTPAGTRTLEVDAVVADYTTSQGAVLTGAGFFQRSALGEAGEGPHAIGLYLAEGADVEAVMDRIDSEPDAGDPLRVRSDRDLREASLAVFDRTFAITEVLRLLMVVVAALGVFGALLALALERSRETALLRAIGLSRGQVWRLELLRSTVLGTAAGVLAIGPGLILAHALTTVINQRAFGWTLSMFIDPLRWLEGVALAAAAALIAGFAPAWRASRTAPGAALRTEGA